MRNAVFVMVGGALGAILRVALKNPDFWNAFGNFPMGTLVVNLIGSFLLAFLLTVTIDAFSVDIHLRTGLATGFLGAFTTFSTLCKDAFVLMQQGHSIAAILYLLISTLLGLLLAYIGYKAARIIVRRHQSHLAELNRKVGDAS